MIPVKMTFANGHSETIATVNGIHVHDGGVLSLQLESTEARVHYSPSFWQSVEIEAPPQYDVSASVQ